MRGGIFDIYSFGMAEPVRLEFWGDEVSELRHFDLISQRSTRDAELALVLPVDGQLSGTSEESERVSITALFAPRHDRRHSRRTRGSGPSFAARGTRRSTISISRAGAARILPDAASFTTLRTQR